MDAPKDTDREFFNAVLAGTATDNYINDYIEYSDKKGQLHNLEVFFFCEWFCGKGFSAGWVNQMGSNTRWYVPSVPPSYTNSQLDRLSKVYNQIRNYQKSHTEPTKRRKTFEVDLERLPLDTLCGIFRTLKDWGKFGADVDVKDFLAVCGCLDDEADTAKPIVWTGTNTELAYFVNKIQGKGGLNYDFWDVAQNNFINKEGKAIKNLSQSYNNINPQNQKFEKIATLFEVNEK